MTAASCPLKGEGNEEIQETTADLSAAKEISVDTALVIVLSKPHGFFFFTLKEQKTAPKLLLPDSTGSQKKKNQISML